MFDDEIHWCWENCCDLGPHDCICGNECLPLPGGRAGDSLNTDWVHKDFLPTDVLDKAVRIMRANGWMPPIAMEWRLPPPITRNRPASLEPRAVIRQLQEFPGEWARVERNVTRSTPKRNWQNLRLEVVTRRAEYGEGLDVYARWPKGQLLDGDEVYDYD